MAWRSSGNSNAELVDNLAAHGMLPVDPATDTVDACARTALLAVDRAHFAARHPYDDAPQSIGHGVTISAPHMHALALRYLWPYLVPRPDRPAVRVLDVGAGSGYLTNVLGAVVGPQGFVLGIECIPELCAQAEANMRRSAAGAQLLDSQRVVLAVGDGRQGARGLSAESMDRLGPGLDRAALEAMRFDAIHVGAAATADYDALVQQLQSPGRLFLPVQEPDSELQYIWTVDKDAAGQVTKTKHFGVRYVPLVDGPTSTESPPALPMAG